MSGDPEQEYFADGIVDDIITALSRIGWLFVIARNSSFTYKGTSPSTCARSGANLACATCWKAASARPANRVRITAQLIDAATGDHIWADRFDGDSGGRVRSSGPHHGNGRWDD